MSQRKPRPLYLLAFALVATVAGFLTWKREGAAPVAARRLPEGESPERSGVKVDPQGYVSANEWKLYFEANARPDQLARAWTLRGTLRQPDGRPAPRLIVRLELLAVPGGTPRPAMVSLRAGEDGSFSFESLPEARAARLRIDDGGWALPGIVEDIRPEAARKPLSLTAIPPTRITARLRTADGAAPPEWFAGIRRIGGPNLVPMPPDAPAPQRNGIFTGDTLRYDRITTGTWELEVIVPGYGAARRRVDATRGGGLQDIGEIEIPRGPYLTVDLGDGPLPPRTRVMLERRHGYIDTDPRRRRRGYSPEGYAADTHFAELTDAARPGPVTVGPLRGGEYLLRIQYPAGQTEEFLDLHIEPVRIGEESQTRRLAVAMPVRLRGYVRDETGVALPGALVSYRRLGAWSEQTATVTANGSGAFEILAPAAQVHVFARPSSQQNWPRVDRILDLSAGGERETALVFQNIAELSGVVEVGEGANPDIAPQLRWRGRRQERISGVSLPIDREGAFTLRLPRDHYDLFDGSRYLATVNLRQPGQRTLRVEAGALRILVAAEDASGRPLPATRFATILDPVAASEATRQFLVPPLRGTPEGKESFLFANIAKGEYDLIAVTPERTRIRERITVTGGDPLRRTVRFGAGDAPAVRVRVRDHCGRPVPSATIFGFRTNGRILYHPVVSTDEQGEAELRTLEAGDLGFYVAPHEDFDQLAATYATVEGLEPGTCREVEVRLVPGARLRVAVVDSDGLAVLSARLMLEPLEPLTAEEAASLEHVNRMPWHPDLGGMLPSVAVPRGKRMLARVSADGQPDLAIPILLRDANPRVLVAEYPR